MLNLFVLKNIYNYLMNIFKYICHRKPERSFHIKNHQFPVCARCTGFYTGLAVYLVLNHIKPHPYNLTIFIISLILMIPVSVDGLSQYFGPRESTNMIRFITGFVGGIGLIIFLKTIFYMMKPF